MNIGAGSYTVTITDADGCKTTGNYTITQPTALIASIVKTDDPGNGGAGSATVNPSGGTSAYTYMWSKTGDTNFSATTQTINNIGYGEYVVKVTDANGCFRTFTVFIYAKEICNDGIDNDGDGLNNCDDSDCIPVTPGSITSGTAIPCVGDQAIYTVPLNANYDSYEWTVPLNATINGGQGTNSITITWNTTAGGQICVQGKKYDCLSAPSCINVTVNDVPPQPGDIILNNN